MPYSRRACRICGIVNTDAFPISSNGRCPTCARNARLEGARRGAAAGRLVLDVKKAVADVTIRGGTGPGKDVHLAGVVIGRVLRDGSRWYWAAAPAPDLFRQFAYRTRKAAVAALVTVHLSRERQTQP